jgi:Sulfotransferase family
VKELVHPDWVRRMNLFGETAGDPARIVSLDADEMLATARDATGLDDVNEAEWPGWEETYRRLVDAIDRESRLHVVGRVMTRGEVLRMLQTWLRLQAAWRATPSITTEPVAAPLFVVGPPRTGTTILLELLALDPSLRAPLAWEALHPLPEAADPATDRALRLRRSECEQEFWSDVQPEFMTMHELASDLPCECVHFLAYDFAGPHWSMLYETPSFTGWQLERIEPLLERVYRLHRRMLQTFQHGSEPRRWLLKSPGHLQTLAQVFAEYPDAKVIHTHRDPRRFIASLASLLGVLRFTRSDAVDVGAIGPLMELTYQMFLEQVIDQRESGVIPAAQIVDSHFLDLMADPVAALRRLYEQLELEWPVHHDETVRRYLAAKPKGKHGEHRYTFAEVGLSEDSVRATFTRYVEHYGITPEP